MKKILCAVICSVIILSGCSKSSNSSQSSTSSTPPPSSANQLSISGMSFPGSVTVKSGTTVTWVNNDYMTHTVTEDSNAFTSSNLGYGDQFSYTFTKAGTYNYHCKFHAGMTGSIVVE